MKKLLVVLGMVLSLATVTACGGAVNELAESTMTQEQAEGYAQSYVDLVAEVATTGVDIAANAEYFETYCGIPVNVMEAAADSFNSAVSEMGAYQGTISDVEYTENGSSLALKCVINGASKTATVAMDFDLVSGQMKECIVNVNYSFKDLMVNAGLNTILGIGTVFFVLILLWGVIACFNIFPYLESKKNAKKNAKTDSVDNAVAQIVSNEEAQDDTELVAVIAAAVAAYEGATSSDGYVVRSIRRRY